MVTIIQVQYNTDMVFNPVFLDTMLDECIGSSNDWTKDEIPARTKARAAKKEYTLQWLEEIGKDLKDEYRTVENIKVECVDPLFCGAMSILTAKVKVY
jgi:hypothetical protein